MRKFVIAAALVSVALGTPALARDGSPYVGADAGLLKPERLDLRFISAGGASVSDALRLRHKAGYDVDGVFGYDFGMWRLEGELGYKHARLKDAVAERDALAAILAPNAPVNYVATGRGNVVSGLINLLVDLGRDDGFNGSLGVGFGYANARYRAGLVPSNTLNFTSSDSALAWQGIAEVRYPVTSNIDVGVKYRLFRTERLKFGQFCETTCPSTQPFGLSGRFKSSSLLAGVRFNFGGVAAPLPPAPPPPPPPPPPPATQTCPDGSVIPATAACPPPPPPPPPPAQRGERGE
jgi:opacity protein-like surface antigen